MSKTNTKKPVATTPSVIKTKEPIKGSENQSGPVPVGLSIEEIYQKKTQHQHILDLPDSYIGGVCNDLKETYVYDNETNKIVSKDIMFPDGLYKIVDEILVNAKDHTVRDKTCKNIEININQAEGIIEVKNDGNGIPVEIHKIYNVYVPEMMFCELLTSTNYDKSVKKTTGGKNGYGAKLTNIYSTEFIIETVDIANQKHYRQVCSNNMYTINPPTITNLVSKTKQTPYTKITFKPDFARFDVKCLTDDFISLLKKRTYDIAACTIGVATVKYNGSVIKLNSFSDYINLYYDKLPSELIYCEFNDRWKVGVLFDKIAGHKNIAFVNGIYTYKAGNHVSYVMNQICTKINDALKDKSLKIKSSYISDNITIFIDSIIENPGFQSQTKDMLITKISEFGSKCEITDEFMKKLFKTGILEEVRNLADFKEKGELSKTDFKKTINVSQIDKLEDAQWAGKNKKAEQCRLILTEGDSAKKFAIDGLSVIGREKYGVFPLRGKFLNVREATVKQIMKNEEFKNLKLILGLKQNKKYTTTKGLRYGGIIILTDQDLDGSHIKGLLINMFDFMWPELLKIPGFIQCITTPIVKVFKKSDTKKTSPEIFYTISDYKAWQETIDMNKYESKYYKGLGTSTTAEAKEVFKDITNRLANYQWEMNENDKNDKQILEEIDDQEQALITEQDDDIEITDEIEADGLVDADEDDDEISEDMEANTKDEFSPSRMSIKLAFEKSRANLRKNWLYNYHKDDILDIKETNINYSDFINKDLKHFSAYDNRRSIPRLQDGLKPSQRKILYACFKRKLFKTDLKVAQLGGYVGEHTEYHHGEQSLYGTITNMAQTFVGSNNINLLFPAGNFGTRRLGGKDAASARYTFTHLSHITPYIFKQADEIIYDYVDEDGTLVEPEFYAPILPYVLANGGDGIGTGFSSFIPPYNPVDLVNYIKKLLDGDEGDELIPWFRGFTGKVEVSKDGRVLTHGIYEILDDRRVKVSELPISTNTNPMWMETYKDYLTEMTVDAKNENKAKFVESIVYNTSNSVVDFTITFSGNKLQEFLKNNTLEKKLKMTTSLSLNNMYLWNTKDVITKYDTVDDIILEFYKMRYSMYEKRKNLQIKIMENELNILKEKIRFVEYYLSKKIIIHDRKEEEVLNDLVKYNFKELSYDIIKKSENPSYAYLTNMRLMSLTKTQMDELKKECNSKQNTYDICLKKTIKQLWTEELDEFLVQYEQSKNDGVDNDEDENNDKNNKPKKTKSTPKSPQKKVLKSN